MRKDGVAEEAVDGHPVDLPRRSFRGRGHGEDGARVLAQYAEVCLPPVVRALDLARAECQGVAVAEGDEGTGAVVEGQREPFFEPQASDPGRVLGEHRAGVEGPQVEDVVTRAESGDVAAVLALIRRSEHGRRDVVAPDLVERAQGLVDRDRIDDIAVADLAQCPTDGVEQFPVPDEVRPIVIESLAEVGELEDVNSEAQQQDRLTLDRAVVDHSRSPSVHGYG
jgi:hypothetical protein